jgi:hypothetical protein
MKSVNYLFFALMTLYSFTAGAQSKGKTKSGDGYTIYEKGSYMAYVEVRKDIKGLNNVVQIQAMNVSGGSGTITMPGSSKVESGGILPGADITDISLVQGRYNSVRDVMKTPKSVTKKLIDVEYPLRIRVNISQQILDVELKEPGSWNVLVRMNQ